MRQVESLPLQARAIASGEGRSFASMCRRSSRSTNAVDCLVSSPKARRCFDLIAHMPVATKRGSERFLTSAPTSPYSFRGIHKLPRRSRAPRIGLAGARPLYIRSNLRSRTAADTFRGGQARGKAGLGGDLRNSRCTHRPAHSTYNAGRGHLSKFGFTAPQGPSHIQQLEVRSSDFQTARCCLVLIVEAQRGLRTDEDRCS